MAAQSDVTSLSLGLLIYDLLSASDSVAEAGCRSVFPVVSEADAQLPYICYRRSSVETVAVKGHQGPDSALIEVICYASTYAQSIALAEAVRSTLDGYSGPGASILLSDSAEAWNDDAYEQLLTFVIRC